MAEVLDNDYIHNIDGMTSAEARKKWNDAGLYPVMRTDDNVYDVEVPVQAVWRGVVFARNQSEAIEQAEMFIENEWRMFISDASICCGEVDEIEIG